MSFLNGLLLLGGLAFVVPLIIHLLNRSKFQTVDWGAMHLLESIELQNSRRVQWQAWLLLLLRCLLPIILALCMARPIWNWWMTGTAGQAATTILVLDDSFSMQAQSRANKAGAANTTLFEQSIEASTQIVRSLGSRSAKSIITAGGNASTVTDGTSYDLRPIERQLERIEPNARGANPAAALQMAIETAAQTSDPYRQVLLWSDFQKHDWEQVPSQTWQTLRQQLQSLPAPASIHFFPQQSQTVENLSLWIDSETTELSLVGEPLEVRAMVANRGSQEARNVPVRFFVDEQEVAVKRIDLAPNAETQTSFMVTIEQPGSHTVKLMVEDDKGMDGDDSDDLLIETLEPLRILFVETRTDLSLLELETGFIQLALQATLRNEGDSSGLQMNRISPDRLNAAALDGIDLVLMANVPRVSDETARLLVERIEAGLTLFVFGGDQVDRQWYNQTWGPASGNPILPFAVGEPMDASNARSAAVVDANTDDAGRTKSLRVAAPPYDDPALGLFNNPQQGRLDQVSVNRWHRFDQERESNDLSPQARPLLKLADGTLLVAKRSHGQGTVFQWSVRANDAWSDLPTRPAYLPLMQRLILFSQGSPEPRAMAASSREAKIDPMSEDELAALAANLGATIHPSASEFLEADSQRQYGWDIWRWVLLVVLLVLFGELFVEKRITRGLA
ncbi:MAG: BatA domain-containing protein [Planctomycetaceae bacterium]|nr:BatA domain-containing protein [Planctomycetaceae bacterium]